MIKSRFFKRICGVLFLFSSTHLISQVNICLGDDTTLCAGSSVTIDLCSPGGPEEFLGGIHLDAPTIIPTLSDDSWSGAANIGFNFTFYGNTYNQFVMGSNGVISFNMGNAGGYCP